MLISFPQVSGRFGIVHIYGVLCFVLSSRPKKTQVVNHGIPADSMGMFPYPSSDGTSSAVSFFAGSPALFRANSNHFLCFY